MEPCAFCSAPIDYVWSPQRGRVRTVDLGTGRPHRCVPPQVHPTNERDLAPRPKPRPQKVPTRPGPPKGQQPKGRGRGGVEI